MLGLKFVNATFGLFEPEGVQVPCLAISSSMHTAACATLFYHRDGYTAQDIRFWTLYVGFLCGAGSGLVVINNVSSLAESLGMSSSTLLVSNSRHTRSHYAVDLSRIQSEYKDSCTERNR